MGETPIYDDEHSEKPVIRPRLEGASVPTDSDEDGTNSGPESSEEIRNAEENGETPTEQELSDEEQLAGAFYRAQAEDETSGNLFRDDDKQIGGFMRARTTVGRLSKNKSTWAVGGGIAGFVLVGFSLFSFLNVFRLDHILNNIDSKTFSRFNAAFEDRSDMWMKSYIKLRLTEINGDTNPGQDTLFFRANKVDRDNPIRDWYRTMRTSEFEKDLWEKSGIKFTSMVDRDGNISSGFIEVKNSPTLSFDTNAQYVNIMDDLASGNLDAFNKLGSDVDLFVNTTVFENNKVARKAIRQSVKDNTRAWQVMKRRHIRKDIQNMTGIKDWRFFEKTRDKIDNKKIAIQKKILNKVFVGNSNSMKLLKCVFAVARCPTTSDPSDPENKANGSASGKTAINDNETEQGDTNGDGQPDETLTSRGADVQEDVERAARKAVENEAEDAIENEVIQLGPIQKFIVDISSSLLGGGPTKAWSWAKRLTVIHNLFSSANGEDSAIVRIVKNARLSQVTAIYTTYNIARDQMKSGELVGDELNNFMGTMNGFGNSEGWSRISNSSNTGQVSAQGTTPPTKEDYCQPTYDKSVEKNEFAWFCDSQKPNSGGNAAALTNAYNGTVGKIIGPIAAAVNGINRSIIGGIVNAVNGAIDSVINTVLSPVFDQLLSATGLGKTIANALTVVMGKLMEFLGAGPMFDGSQAGVANYLMAGSAGTAEGTTRASGGIKSTQQSLAYSNQLADVLTKEERDSESLWTRYASINNPRSLFSSALFTASDNRSVASALSRLGNTSRTLSNILSLFTPRALAQSDEPASATAQWAGVDTYDIPQVCVDADPLTTTLEGGTNAQTIGVNLSWDLVRDTDKFWAAVYAKARSVNPDNPESVTANIYNCHLLDARIAGSMGYVYGYEKDNGYDVTRSASSSATVTPSGGLGISAEGFVFPLKTTKSTLRNHSPTWCFENQDNCHHDYNAADIFAPTGTIVVAPTDGEIIATRDQSGGVGSFAILRSDRGYIFYFAHMGGGTLKVSPGQQVTAGTEIGLVGTADDAEGTTPHIHFDAQAAPPATTRLGCSNAACAEPPFDFINVQPTLVSAFNGLPE